VKQASSRCRQFSVRRRQKSGNKREAADQSPMTYSSAIANSGWGIKSGGDDAVVATFIRLDGIVAAVIQALSNAAEHAPNSDIQLSRASTLLGLSRWPLRTTDRASTQPMRKSRGAFRTWVIESNRSMGVARYVRSRGRNVDHSSRPVRSSSSSSQATITQGFEASPRRVPSGALLRPLQSCRRDLAKGSARRCRRRRSVRAAHR
jgi:hypothetical protein